ncbi:MAG: LPS-assembly protein LptD [Candidatus Lindowbacteria bacterium]|nr:LPS-assembly protein LptD [Candidatus Lindowbacteria bacterium]
MIVTLLTAILVLTAQPQVLVEADTSSYNTRTKEVLLQGNVVIERQYDDGDSAIKLYANQVGGQIEGVLQASGDVRIEYGDISARAQSGYYDMPLSTGSFENVSMTLDSWYLKASNIQLHPPNRFELKDVRMTACDHVPPHYDFRVKRAYFKNNRVSLFGAKMFIKKIPIMWVPYMTFIPGRPSSPFQIRVGRSSYEGYFLKTAYRYDFPKIGFGKLKYAGRSRRGWGYGWEHHFPLYRGAVDLDLYRIDERDRGGRGIARVQYEQDYSDHLRALADVYYLTDRNFLRDYRFKNFINDPTPKSFGSLTYSVNNATSMIRVVANNNRGDYNVIERLPELRAQLLSQPIWGGVYGTVEGSLTAFRTQRPDDNDSAINTSLSRRLDAPLESFVRSHAELRFDRPTRVPLGWTLTPYTQLDVVTYSEVDKQKGTEVRSMPAVGMMLSRFFRYRIGSGYSYMVRPALDFANRWQNGKDPGRTPLVDANIDFLQRGRPLKLIFDQGLYRRKGRSWKERLRIRMDGGFDFNTTRDLRYLPLKAKVTARFGAGGQADGEVIYDKNKKAIESSRAEMSYSRTKWTVTAGYFHRRDAPGVDKQENLTARGTARFGKGPHLGYSWSATLGGSYNLGRGNMEYMTIELEKNLHDFVIGAGITESRFSTGWTLRYLLS